MATTTTRTSSYRTWARSLLSPRTRLLPGLGARLGARPRLAATLLVGLRRLPGRRVRAIAYRQLSLPLVERMHAELEVPVVGGFRMLADTTDVPGRALATAGIWEPYVTETLRSLLAPGDVFVDVGANVGYYAVLASRLVGREGHVYALEPGPQAFASLRRNLELNDAANVTALPVAAGAAEGRGALFGPRPGNTGTSSLRRVSNAVVPGGEVGDESTDVAVRPVSSLLAESERGRLRAVKIDVEGFEAEVLRGLEALFDEGLRPALIVEIHAAFDPDAPAYVTGFCERFGLRARWLVDDGSVDLHRAPADRPTVARELSLPLDLASMPRNRYDLLLTAS
jgi:FkbM family methyltransferase